MSNVSKIKCHQCQQNQMSTMSNVNYVKSAHICWDLPRSVKIRPDLLRSVQICQNPTRSKYQSNCQMSVLSVCGLGCPTKTCFSKKKNGSTRSTSIWGLLWRNPKGFLILTSFKGCTSSLKMEGQSTLQGAYKPYKPKKILLDLVYMHPGELTDPPFSTSLCTP